MRGRYGAAVDQFAGRIDRHGTSSGQYLPAVADHCIRMCRHQGDFAGVHATQYAGIDRVRRRSAGRRRAAGRRSSPSVDRNVVLSGDDAYVATPYRCIDVRRTGQDVRVIATLRIQTAPGYRYFALPYGKSGQCAALVMRLAGG